MTAKSNKKIQDAVRYRIVGIDNFRYWLRVWADQVGHAALAAEVGLRRDQLSQILTGKASIGAAVAARLGFDCRDVRVFTPKEAKDAKQTPRS